MAEYKLSNGCSKYGADMGRMSLHAEDRNEELKFSVAAVRLDSGGYDNGGAYWGTRERGFRLYRASAETSDGTKIEFFFQASTDRESARAYVRSHYPRARFYR